jgi:hypothetical protein
MRATVELSSSLSKTYLLYCVEVVFNVLEKAGRSTSTSYSMIWVCPVSGAAEAG